MQSGNEDLFIRPATSKDVSSILNCLKEAFGPYQQAYTREAFSDTILDTKSVERRMKEMQLFVAVTGGKVVGTIGCKAKPPEGHLRGMAVLPASQGTAVAAKLLRVAEDELRRRSCSFVTLDTTELLKRAGRFYEKHGYAVSGNVTDFFGMALIEYKKQL